MNTVYLKGQFGIWRRLLLRPDKIGSGGEGTVRRSQDGTFAVKIFGKLAAAVLATKRAKIDWFCDPANAIHFKSEFGFPDWSIPEFPVFSSQDDTSFIGYGMRFMPDYDPLTDTYHASSHTFRLYNLKRRVTLCAYITYLFARCHAVSVPVIIGDVKPDNIRINQKSDHIIIVDTDSFQITIGSRVLTSDAFTPEYCSARLLAAIENAPGKSIVGVARTENDDLHAMAVILFQMIMDGFHPFAGSRTAGSPNQQENLKNRSFPYSPNCPIPAPNQAPITRYTQLPAEIRSLFEDTFVKRKYHSAKEWQTVFAHHARNIKSTPIGNPVPFAQRIMQPRNTPAQPTPPNAPPTAQPQPKASPAPISAGLPPHLASQRNNLAASFFSSILIPGVIILLVFAAYFDLLPKGNVSTPAARISPTRSYPSPAVSRLSIAQQKPKIFHPSPPMEFNRWRFETTDGTHHNATVFTARKFLTIQCHSTSRQLIVALFLPGVDLRLTPDQWYTDNIYRFVVDGSVNRVTKLMYLPTGGKIFYASVVPANSGLIRSIQSGSRLVIENIDRGIPLAEFPLEMSREAISTLIGSCRT